MRLTVVLLFAASLVGTISAARAAQGDGAAPPAPVLGSVMFDDQVTPAGYGCGDHEAAYDDGCDSCGCDSGGCGGRHRHGCRHGDDGCGCDEGCGLPDGCGGGCHDGCGCEECAGLLDGCSGQPWVRFRAEALPLHRSTSNHVVDFGTFTTDDFDFRFEPGVRVAAEVRVGCECSLEVSYFGLHRWDDRLLQDFGGGDIIEASYTSELQGGEINYWMPIPLHSCRVKAAFTFGTKYFDLHEEFGVNQRAFIRPEFFDETENHFLAPQIGFMLSGCLPHGFSARWDGKAGVGANLTARQSAQSGFAVPPRQEDSNAAFIGDTNVALSYQLCCNVSIYAGYYLLWVDGLALAPQQSLVPPNEINHNGFVLFQGGFAGIETTW